MEPSQRDAETKPDVLRVVLAGLAGLSCLAQVWFGAVVAPSFAKMFADFGDPIPLLTRLMIGGLPLVTAGLTAAAGASGWMLRRRAPGPSLGLLIGALVLGVLLACAGLVAMYLPIFALAGNIK